LKIKLKAGNEMLTGGNSRWFAGFETYDYLHNLGTDAGIEIDGKDVTLTPNDDETEKNILYNNVKTGMDYAEGTNSETGTEIKVGFIEYAEQIVIISNYSDGKFSMNLVSIQTPASKKAVTTEEKFTKGIVDPMASKTAVP
jgi:hypothetical protein